MKTPSIVLLALLALTAFEARASEADTTRFATPSGPSSATRAEVRQETRRALGAREIPFGDVVQAPPLATAGRTRMEVRDETLMALMQRTPAGERSLYAN